MKQCSIEGCERPFNSRGLCARHVARLRRHGDPLVHKNYKGGVSKHPLYGAWCGMINRCHNPNNSSYQSYGAKGIYVCDRWRNSFADWLADMGGERPAGHSLDRIDPSGPYSPENCRWASFSVQRNNQSAEGKRNQAAGARSGAIKRHHPDWQKAASEV